MQTDEKLFQPLTLPCGVSLKNRIIKSAMSDSLGDGTGHPTSEQNSLYARWALGGVAAAIVGEVQGVPGYAEKPGNLVLNEHSDLSRFCELADAGSANGTLLWLQLGHAGALSYTPTSQPKGPSALDLPGLNCAEMSVAEIQSLPLAFAQTAKLAQQAGFGGVQLHAAHGFLLSQFLSPLFNHRKDDYGGALANRMRLILDSITAVRAAVGPHFPISLKLNATDQLEGGFIEDEALEVIKALDQTSVDLIDISGGTYFPGAKAASDKAGQGPYFFAFAKRARAATTKPLMLTGGFKTHAQAEEAIASGTIDIVGLARAIVLEPNLPNLWKKKQLPSPVFPRFANAPEGGVTAWYTMRITEIAAHKDLPEFDGLEAAIKAYALRDRHRTEIWKRHFAEN